MSNFIPVEGNSDLVRDPNTDQIINTNTSAYQQYINRREQRKREKEKSLNVEEAISSSTFKDFSFPRLRCSRRLIYC